jgi:hypothetical protein
MFRSVKYWASATALSVIASAIAWAAPVDGKWTWKQMRQQEEVTINMELKADGEKLTGAVTQGDQKLEIKEGTIKGQDVAFVVVRERNGQEFKTVYKGKLDGDTIKGNIITNFGGQERMRDWAATRVK